jgi:multiple sugar transport system permease protein
MTRRVNVMRTLTPYLFAAPAVIYLVGLWIYPIVYAVNLSMHDVQIYQLATGGTFNGFQNYVALMRNERFWNSLRVTVELMVIAVTCEFLLGLGLALLLNSAIRARRFFRAVALIPLMLTPVVLGIDFKMMFNYLYGVVNWALSVIGLKPVLWLADPTWGMVSILITEVWNQSAFVALVLLAGLQSIPTELYESAHVDGANAFAIFWRIRLPLIMPMIFVAVFWRSIALFRIFDVVFVLTSGGPSYTTESLSLLVNNLGYLAGRMGMASALSMLMIALMIAFALVYNRFFRFEKE